ncbi:hypothetical protein BJ912DRAFT_929914 [Pholiota molesta]|nr:hypothetical protein BJ912DRAFT_929914 [Pholiota molesta]
MIAHPSVSVNCQTSHRIAAHNPQTSLLKGLQANRQHSTNKDSCGPHSHSTTQPAYMADPVPSRSTERNVHRAWGGSEVGTGKTEWEARRPSRKQVHIVQIRDSNWNGRRDARGAGAVGHGRGRGREEKGWSLLEKGKQDWGLCRAFGISFDS